MPFDIPANLTNRRGIPIEAKINQNFTTGRYGMNVGRTMIVGIDNNPESLYPTARHLPSSIPASFLQATTLAWVLQIRLGF